MKPYDASVFKGHHVFKSNLKDGSPYKQRTFLMLISDNNDLVIATSRIVKSEERPDQWHSFIRRFNDCNYWLQMSGVKMEHYIEINQYINDKIAYLTDKINKIKNQ